MISDRLFVYGTLMRGFDHPMAQLLSRSADFLGTATCRGRLYLIKHYPGLVLSDDPADVVFADGTAGEAWTYVYNWPVTGLPQIASGKFLES